MKQAIMPYNNAHTNETLSLQFFIMKCIIRKQRYKESGKANIHV